uniref:Si:ch1073-412h12.3 n=1 Tax=Erpetoichthys calabaricus TaxID=27687 RepID=A0A8C4RNX0_ERPCA
SAQQVNINKRKAERKKNTTNKKNEVKEHKMQFNFITCFLVLLQFGYMLDDNMGSKFDNIGINAMANKDNADMKQIKWELQRDDWLHGRDARTLRTKKMKFKRNKYPEKKKGIYKKPRK